MQKYLKPSKLKIEAKGIKSVKSNVVNMKDILSDNAQVTLPSTLMYDMSMQLIKNFIKKYQFGNQASLVIIDSIDEDMNNSYLKLVDSFDDKIFKDVTYATTVSLLNNNKIGENFARLNDKKMIFGKIPDFTHQFEKRFEWGTITLQFNVIKNIIKNINCYTNSVEVELPKLLNNIFHHVYYNKNIIGSISMRISIS